MVWVDPPRFGVADGFLFGGIVGIERIFLGVDKLDVIIEFCLGQL